MKKIILLFAALLSTVAVNAQQANLVWAKAFAAPNATGYPGVYNSVLEPSGTGVLVGGNFKGTIDFDPSANDLLLTGTSTWSGFVLRMNAAGSTVWAKTITTTSEVFVTAIQEDAAGNIYVGGFFKGTADLNPDSLLTGTVTAVGDRDIFVTKWNANGAFIWGKSLGNAGSNILNAIVLDASGFLHLTFNYRDSIDADPGTGVSYFHSNGLDDALVVKLASNGGYVSAFSLGGPYVDDISDLKVTAANELLVVAKILGTVDADPGAGTQLVTVSSGNVGGLVLKLNASGQYMTSYFFEPTGAQSAIMPECIGLDATGNIYLTGTYSGTADVDPGAANVQIQSFMNTEDMFLLKLSPSGSYLWSAVFGANYPDYCSQLGVLPDGHCYMRGQFGGTIDLDPDAVGTYNITATNGNTTAYECIIGLNSDGTFSWGRLVNGFGSGYIGPTIVSDGNNTIYTCGYFGGTADFDPNSNVYNLSCLFNTTGAFVTKFSNLVTAMNEITAFDGLLYPNPATEQLTIRAGYSLESSALTVYDAKGAAVQVPVMVENQTMLLDVHTLPAGLYFGTLMGDEASSFRFAVMH